MTLHAYMLFVGASIVLVLVPGPDMIYMLSRCIAQGRRAGTVAALGINAGGYVHLIAAITGLSAILLTSATAFTMVKWAGAIYLIYLGVRTLFNSGDGIEVSVSGLKGKSLKAVFWQGFLSDALNPKVAIFFLALLPQFVSPSSGNAIGQLLLLGVTVNMVAILINLVLVLLSSYVTHGIRRNPRLTFWLQKTMGMIFIGLGARLATEKA